MTFVAFAEEGTIEALKFSNDILIQNGHTCKMSGCFYKIEY